jgi:hypothetical protein
MYLKMLKFTKWVSMVPRVQSFFLHLRLFYTILYSHWFICRLNVVEVYLTEILISVCLLENRGTKNKS